MLKRQHRHRPKQSHSFKVSLALAAISPFLLAAYGWEAGTTSSTVTQGLAELDKSVLNKVMRQSASYTTTIKDNTSVLNEAIKTSVTQEALSAQQVSNADKKARQMGVAVVQAQKLSDDLIDVRLNYGAATGQGHDVCQVYTENKQLDNAVKSAATVARNKVLNVDNAPGRVANSNMAVLKQRNAVHTSNFCSPEEVEAGECEVSSTVAGADSNANVLFTSSKPGTKISAAKAAVRQNILGKPDLSIPKSVGGTIPGQAYLANVNHKTALSAFPAYSLAYLESMSEVRDDLKDEKGVSQSPNDVLFNTVTRYYGGEDSKEWTKSMIAQQPRGLMVELAKMEGLGAWMDYQEYLANQRLEGNIAAMTLTSALPMEETLNRQARSLRKKQTASTLSQ
ncbi:hypothetical protein [Psychrobacter sp. AOP31-A1-22]|uniref:hypothetical protein n=1 Tax=Psychrobacter sp. AOP31-A1-22 TaxID=3457696 RepID=UPI0040365B3C